ncbi:Acetyltransferase involved in cellulose biosynthesis, CelD/BcsL family [Cribrihabitans marinus]|uniref:Acetyltransferase involved in cellulose biosynthesis, CelD/BcsL family n=1 Tax=Cribrihabitans marinus TaxID=1227549 RepID=A0A1H6SWZ3_9RHOB|nr:GNAT family N-acetyltransferase [Cribrihabitans marinus]GGH23215.1 hypothetical protein GCM10010973_08970 [Cribrihabitans marinus]SEI68530.1 Acetyltransferase involved in cellulose biosynthesis, CelD/BcsL family [Cribrihabitans marinus]
MSEANGPQPGDTAPLLRVELVDRFERFAALRPAWQVLESRDPEATVFLSWDWLAQAFRPAPGQWRVMAVFRGAALVAVLPLSYRVAWGPDRMSLQTRIASGGRLVSSPYCGLLCEPGYENSAIGALAGLLRTMPWARMTLHGVTVPRRADRLLKAFDAESVAVSRNGGPGGRAELDLPRAFDTYLRRDPDAAIREAIERHAPGGAGRGRLSVELASGRGAKAQLGAMLRLWMVDHAGSRGAAAARAAAARYLHLLGCADRMGRLGLVVLRSDDALLGAFAHVTDPRRRVAHAVLGAVDTQATNLPVATVLRAEAIRWAIGQGFTRYDFGPAPIAEARAFGAMPRPLVSLSLQRRGAPAGQDCLDPIGHRAALRLVLNRVESGKAGSAAAGLRQIIDRMDPTSRD